MTNPDPGAPGPIGDSGQTGQPGADPYGSYPAQSDPAQSGQIQPAQPGAPVPYQPAGYGQPNPASLQGQAGWNPGVPINNNLGWAIGAIIACWPFGIPALIKALNVNTQWMQGRPDLAQQSADEAKKWGKIGVFVAAGFLGLYVLFFVGYFIFLFGVLGLGLAGS